jgi:hypothetical protein
MTIQAQSVMSDQAEYHNQVQSHNSIPTTTPIASHSASVYAGVCVSVFLEVQFSLWVQLLFVRPPTLNLILY